MDNRESCDTLAAVIAEWQLAAQELPLTELCGLVAEWQTSLAESLDNFNDLYLNHADCDGSADMIALALGAVAKRATAVAIFTLGIACRADQYAHPN